jgi:hypothetical protein
VDDVAQPQRTLACMSAMSKSPTEGASVNGALLEAFRHNSWATRQLLAVCRDLSEEQLAASATGAYGSIRSTFNHLVLSDGRYLSAPS